MRARSFRKYFRSFMNIIDLIGHACGVAWGFAYLNNYKDIASDLDLNRDEIVDPTAEIQKLTTQAMNGDPF